MELKNSMKRAIVMKTIPSLAGKVGVVTQVQAEASAQVLQRCLVSRVRRST
jgi:hypothetical protein